MSDPAILQFGTGRLLQAHVDLMVSEALAAGEAIGTIAAVQTTGSASALARVRALRAGGGYPVRLKGLVDGRPSEREVRVTSVVRAFDAAGEWEAVEALALGVQAIVSNTADRGYELDPADRPEDRVPRSFPAKLLKLLHARWRHRAEPVTLFPCELISRNGEVLRGVVAGLAAEWGMEPAFRAWLEQRCIWACSLVDRIVAEALDPIGAVAEPYALWAIEDAPGLRPVCRHPDLVVTADLARYERLKLFILNLGHTWLAERWLLDRRPRGRDRARGTVGPRPRPEPGAGLRRGGPAGVRGPRPRRRRARLPPDHGRAVPQPLPAPSPGRHRGQPCRQEAAPVRGADRARRRGGA